MTDPADQLSVVIPTVGRARLLEATLDSLARCSPAPAEVVVVDQSDHEAVAAVVEEARLPQARVSACSGAGRGAAVNSGLRAAAHSLVAIVDDDCSVRADWVGAALRAMAADPGGITSGQVLPEVGVDADRVPSLLILEHPVDYTGQRNPRVLYGGNMVCDREAVLGIGGFDEAIVPAAEDCELCYRWLRAGRSLRHDPELVVWHRDWRSVDELVTRYAEYWRGQGVFYGRHLRRGDIMVLRFVLEDLYGWAGALVAGTDPARDPRRTILMGLPGGLVSGLRA